MSLPVTDSVRPCASLRADGIAWAAQGSTPALKDLYLGAMDALWALTPGSPIFFIEGGGQTGFNTNWGNGFVTDKSLIQQYGLSDPNPFFQALLTKPYANRTVIAPHVYGPSVTNNNNDYKGVDLWYRCASL